MTADGIARSVSLFLYVGTVCPKFHKINKDLVGRYFMAEASVGEKTIGKTKFSALLADELLRRGKEINHTGARPWCSGQRANLKGMGLTAIYE